MAYTFTLDSDPTVQITLPRVSDILSVLAKNGLEHWGWKLALRAFVDNHQNNGDSEDWVLALKDPDALHAYIKDQKRTPWYESKRAMDRGTTVHKAMEAVVKGEPVNLDAHDPTIRPYIEAGINWWEENKSEVVATERTVYCLEHGYAGTVDLVRATPDAVAMVDYKTSKNAYPSHHFQLAAYAHAWAEGGGIPIDRTEIVLLRDNGDFKVVEGKATEQDFLRLLEAWRAVKGIG